MQVSKNLFNILVRSISESFSRTVMIDLVRDLIDSYDLHERTGFPPSIAIPTQDAARQIISDIIERNLFLDFATRLMRIHYDGYRGRTLQISHLRNIVDEIYKNGFIYDKENKIFIEDAKIRRTPNWGAIREGDEQIFSFLRLDIVKSTQLVRKYPDNIIQSTYKDLRKIVETAAEKRNGRIWSWEGDGGLVCFFFANKNLLAVLSGMEILHELFLYNLIKSRIETPIHLRMAINTGACIYTNNGEELKKNETVRKVMEIEADSRPNTLTITNRIHISLDTIVADLFRQTRDDDPYFLNYQIGRCG